MLQSEIVFVFRGLSVGGSIAISAFYTEISNYKSMEGYKLSRQWFDWCFENPEKIKPTHTAMYFFIIEHCNRLGWKEKFGLPMEMTKDAIGIKNYRTYSDTLSDLIEWGFIKEIQKSKNQYSSCIIAIAENTKAHTKALDKALQKHSKKQGQSIVCIDKQETGEQETLEQVAIATTPKQETESFFQSLPENIETVIESISSEEQYHDTIKNELQKFYNYWTEKNSSGTKQRWQMEKTFEVKRRLATWFSKSNFNSYQKPKGVLQA